MSVKDKVVTLESLGVLNEHNKSSYMSKTNPTGNGTMKITGGAEFSGYIQIGSNVQLVATSDSVQIKFLE